MTLGSGMVNASKRYRRVPFVWTPVHRVASVSAHLIPFKQVLEVEWVIG